MSVITSHERPGVYSAYEASSITAAQTGGKTVAIIAGAEDADGTKSYSWYSYAQALSDCGAEGNLAEMARLALKNGAGAVIGVPVGEDYTAAIQTVQALEDVAVVCCDSEDLDVQQALRESVTASAEARQERIAVVSGATGETVTELAARASALNSERVVLAAPGCLDSDGEPLGGGLCAAAVAGLIAGESDPAMPLGGAVLEGLTGLDYRYTDSQLDTLVRGGVTALESLSGEISVVRGVTTRTTTGGVYDSTWRDLTTILVVDEVVPGIRKALRAKFSRAKNTAQTRGAILSQVIVELESRVSKEIIDSYEDVTVTALEDDPGVCLVEFSFTVAHGLNQIWLSAHITI
jgi:phage tail sheath gpL-like